MHSMCLGKRPYETLHECIARCSMCSGMTITSDFDDPMKRHCSILPECNELSVEASTLSAITMCTSSIANTNQQPDTGRANIFSLLVILPSWPSKGYCSVTVFKMMTWYQLVSILNTLTGCYPCYGPDGKFGSNCNDNILQ